MASGSAARSAVLQAGQTEASTRGRALHEGLGQSRRLR
jgi:hypothetical protein